MASTFQIRPTSCKEDVKGWLGTADGGPCIILEGELLPDDGCVFIPDPDNNNGTSSLMYSPYLPSVSSTMLSIKTTSGHLIIISIAFVFNVLTSQ